MNHKQTHVWTTLEVGANVVAKFLLFYFIYMMCIKAGLNDPLLITAVMTGVSVVKNYVIRRIFTHYQHTRK